MRNRLYLLLAVVALSCLAGWTGYARAQRSSPARQTWEYTTNSCTTQQLKSAGVQGWELAGINVPPGAAQKAGTRNTRTANGKLKIWIPSGFVGDNYWIYVNEHLVSSPPHGTPRGDFNIISLHDGSGWEVWVSEGLLTSSTRYDSWISSYIAAGDKRHIFRTIEYPVAPGKHTVEVMISTGGNSRSLPPLPFVITRKYEAVVRAGQTFDVYSEIPSDWNTMRSPISAAWASPCNDTSFDLKKMQNSILYWGRSYRDDPLVKLLHVAKGSYKPGSAVLELDLPSGPREFDGMQIEQIVGEIDMRFSNLRHTHNEIANCRNRFPQYSKTFAEYDKTISLIEDDMASLRKLAAALRSSR